MQSAQPHTRRRLIVAGVLLSLSIVLAQVYKQPLLDLIDGHSGSLQLSPPPCDLNTQACPLPLMTPVASEAPWLFAITPRPVPVSSPLTLTLTPPERILPGNSPSAVWVDLTGDSMDMGVIRIPLALTSDGRWEGTGSIPICVTGQMRWRARLHMVLTQTAVQADWVFSAPLTATEHRAGQP